MLVSCILALLIRRSQVRALSGVPNDFNKLAYEYPHKLTSESRVFQKR